MENEVDYLRRRLAEAGRTRGRVAQIGRATAIDRRTLDKMKDPEHKPHVATVDKLLAYFKQADKKIRFQGAK